MSLSRPTSSKSARARRLRQCRHEHRVVGDDTGDHGHDPANGAHQPAAVFPEPDFEEAWLLWDQSTDDTDPAGLILYEIYLNGVLTPDGGFGSGSGITYCREPGPTAITVRAMDTSGERSAPSNAVTFPC